MLGVGFITDKKALKGSSASELWDSSLTKTITSLLKGTTPSSTIRGVNVRCSLNTHVSHRIGNARASYDPLSGRGVAEGLRNALETVSGLWKNEELEKERGEKLEKQYKTYSEERLRLYSSGAERFETNFWKRRINTDQR